jgi:hypothetical protein
MALTRPEPARRFNFPRRKCGIAKSLRRDNRRAKGHRANKLPSDGYGARGFAAQIDPVFNSAVAAVRLLRGGDTNRDKRHVGRVSFNAAGDAAFTDKRRGIARRAAISGDEDFIAAARRGATAAGQALFADHPDRRAGRTLFALRSWRTGWADRAGRTGRASIAFRALRAGRPRITLRALPATGEQRDQRRGNDQTPSPHLKPFSLLGLRRGRLM